MKVCPKCGESKHEDEFHRCKSYKDGLYYICKKCAMIAKMRYKRSERGRERDKIYRQSPKGKIKGLEIRRKMTLSGKDKSYQRDRYHNDLSFRIGNRLRSRFYCAVRAQLSNKKQHTLDFLGCSLEELKKHLENQFVEGMSWDNWGNECDCWNIDHIIPCSYFDLTKEEDQRICFNFRNLQPLWRKENCGIKNNKVPENVEELVEFLKREIYESICDTSY